jgi:hypothetical protein
MGRGINRFKQTDVVRAVKAATAARMTVGGIKVNTKTSEITVLAKGPQLDNGGEPNEWDALCPDANAERAPG